MSAGKRIPRVGSIVLFWVPPAKAFRPGIVTRTFESASDAGFPTKQMDQETLSFFVAVGGPFLNGIVFHDISDMAKGLQPLGAVSLCAHEPNGGPVNKIWDNEAAWWKWPEAEVEIDLSGFGVH